MGTILQCKEKPKVENAFDKEKNETLENNENLTKNIEELYKNTFDYNSNIVFFPIRHHSPACSYHLKKVIKEYKPEIILIEMMQNAEKIKEFLSDENTTMPVAVYYSYNDSKSHISKERMQYKCYYPFLNQSPELIAIKEGKRLNIETKFIDLDYSEILISSEEGKGLLKKASDKNVYNDDYLIAENEYINLLCEKQNCRNFSELWEKLFEINGLYIETEEFVKSILSYCYISRIYSNDCELKAEGCLDREIFMAENIQRESYKHKKVLVVMGGFHTYGIYKLLDKENKFKSHKIKEEDSNVYLIPYSMERADALNGYASGMIYPSFYDNVWNNIENNLSKPYERAVLNNITKTGKISRENDLCLSTFDEICAYNMAQNLAELRDKKECGIYELIDSVTSSFIKGDLNISTEEPLNILTDIMRGNGIGCLPDNIHVPPIVNDFKEKADKYKLKINSTLEQSLSLEMYSKDKHREISFFLHTMEFLDTEFCVLIKGPDVINNKNLNLVREVWNYKFSTNVNSKLIDISVYGGTLEDAAKVIVKKRIKENIDNSGIVAELLVKSLKMGLVSILNESMDSLNDVIINDNNFNSLMKCLYYLNYIYEVKLLYNARNIDEIKKIIYTTYNKLCMIIPSLFNTKSENELKTINSLKEIYNLSLRREINLDKNILSESLQSILNKKNINSAIEGACIGILYALDDIEIAHIKNRVEGYLLGTKDMMTSIPDFLNGLFCTCRDLIFIDDCILKAMDKLVNTISTEMFINVIPQLRLAFSYFTPREIDSISNKVSVMYGINKEMFNALKTVNPEVFDLGRKLNNYAVEYLKEEDIL